MQLGEVLDQATPEAPPPRRRRRWLLPLVAVAALAGALAVHGPGLARIDAQHVGIVSNDLGLSLIGPPLRAVTRPGWTVYVPIAQHLWLLPRRGRTPEPLRHTVLTADGAAVRLEGASVTYALEPDEAQRTFSTLGADPRAWDRLARAALASAWWDALSDQTTERLSQAGPGPLAPSVRRALEVRLAEHGLTVSELGTPTVRLPPLVQAAAEGLRAARAADAADAAAGRTTQAERVARRATAAEARGASVQAARAEAKLRIAAAEAAGAARLAQAAGEVAQRVAEADARRAALLRRAEVIGVRSVAEAQALDARVAAVREHGAALLDHVIATEVLPQLVGVRAEPSP